MNAWSNGLFIASGAVSLVPGTGVVLGPAGTITGAIGSNAASACVQSQITTINNTLAYQQTEITSIADYLSLESGEFYNSVAALALSGAFGDQSNYFTAFDTLMDPYSGEYSGFMNLTGLWTEGRPTRGLPGLPLFPASAAVSGLAGEKTTFEGLKDNKVTMENLWTIIGSQVVSVEPEPPCTSNCFLNVKQDTASYLLNTYNGLFTYLSTTTLQPLSTAPAANFVPDYDSYNSTLVSFYLRSLVALQAGFSMEWLINQYNFYAAGCAELPTTCAASQQAASSGVCSGTGPNMTDEDSYNSVIRQCFYGGEAIASLGGVPGTNYPPRSPTDLSTPQAAVTAYNEAQKQLALLYAARANRLYLNTLNYIFSDAPSAPQAYPDGGRFITSANCEDTSYTPNPGNQPVKRCVDFQAWSHNIEFEDNVGSLLEKVPGAPSTPLQQVAGTAGTEVPPDWTSDLVLYQFPIQNVYNCANTLKAYNADQEAAGVQGTLKGAFGDPSACPPIFSLSDGSQLNGGLYNGDTLQAYSWVGPEDDPSCPGICTTTPAAPIVYTCGGIHEDSNAAPGDSGSICTPGPAAFCTNSKGKPYPTTCLPSPNGALSLAYDIPSDWNTAAVYTGGWVENCTSLESFARYLPLGPAWETDNPDGGCSFVASNNGTDTQCGNCPNDIYDMAYSCASCPSGHWKNANGTLACADGNPQTAPLFTGVPNSFDNPPTLTTFCYDRNTDSQNLTTASCANAQWEFNADTGQLECGTDPASLCRGFVAGTASCGDPTFAALNTPPISTGTAGTCVGSYGSNAESPVCCGQEGTVGEVTSYICPADLPICTGYIEDVTYGTCQGTEAYTDCTQCGGEPVLTLSAAMPYNVKFCKGGLAPYTLPMSYAGNVSGLRGGLPYLSCNSWVAPQTFDAANLVPKPQGAIVLDATYQTDQVMVGISCIGRIAYSPLAPLWPNEVKGNLAYLTAWTNTDWWCGSAGMPTGGNSTLIDGVVGGSCGTVAFGPPISNNNSTNTLWTSAVSVSLPNAVTGSLSGAQQIPLTLVYQCSENCPGPATGPSSTDHNNCLNVVSMTQASIADNGYTCTTAAQRVSPTTGALICTLIGGQQVTIDLQAENIGDDNRGGGCTTSDYNSCSANSANMEVGQANVGCPSACSQCESGVDGETATGQALDGSGYCTGFCSGYNFCGDSNYNVADEDQAPTDCRQCALIDP
jgi:hypothetical protein